jgi:O-glycosyl hydrolase
LDSLPATDCRSKNLCVAVLSKEILGYYVQLTVIQEWHGNGRGGARVSEYMVGSAVLKKSPAKTKMDISFVFFNYNFVPCFCFLIRLYSFIAAIALVMVKLLW